MKPELQKKYDLRAEVVKALAHPSRLLVVDELAEGEKCVCDLQKLIGSDMSTVSKHLSVLKAAGIITDRREGLKIFYSLQTPCVTKFIDCVTAVLKQRMQQQMEGL